MYKEVSCTMQCRSTEEAQQRSWGEYWKWLTNETVKFAVLIERDQGTRLRILSPTMTRQMTPATAHVHERMRMMLGCLHRCGQLRNDVSANADLPISCTCPLAL
jgi:hypothetical protein